MNRKNATLQALFTSVISLLLCVSMLVGTTYAWFTDSVVSGTNVIAAGNLDVELYHGKDKDPVDAVKTDTLLFTDEGGNEIDKWEPGVVAFTNLKVANVGTLALKYQLSINSTEVNYFTDADGVNHTLAEALKVAVIEGGVSGTREQVVAAATEWKDMLSFTLSGVLEADTTTKTYGIVVYWEPGDNDNLFNMNNGKTTSDGKPLTITLGVNLFATQEMYEDDSFGPDYDKGAPWTGEISDVPAEVDGVITITSPGELAAFADDVNKGNTYKGKTVKLGANIDLNNAPWTPIGNSGNKFDGTFIGTGYTISNLFVTGTKGVGLFGYTWNSAHIEGVTINGAYVSGNDYVGAILGSGYLSANCIKDCTVKNAEIIATPYLENGIYDGGAKAGAIVGSAYNGNLTGNKAIGCTITAYRDLGGIAGMLYADGVTGRTLTASGNTVEDVTLVYFNLNGAAYDGNKVNENLGDVVGRLGRSSEACNMPAVENNTATDVEYKTVVTYIENDIQYTKDVKEDVVTLYKVSAEYEGTTVTVPEGVDSIGRYAFAYNDNIETITLPTTVTTLDERAFRDTSASTVVLNEGLTNISYQAFRNASNVTTVEIPSTVTTISKEAFQSSGITELTVPANVTTIEYGAMRDMKNLEKVVIESNADIPVYAFRACTNLKTVILTGEDVTFGGGSRGMIFTNKENGDGSAITIYVANEVVKERLLAADTAAKDYGGYKIVVAKSASNNDSLKDAIAAGGDVVVLPGTYIFPASSIAAGTTLICSEDTVFEGTSKLNINGATVIGATFSNPTGTAADKTINGTFKDCVFEGREALRWCYAGETVVFENCEFKTDFRGVHFDGMDHDVIFRNCKLNGFNAFGGTATVTFDSCTFGNDQSKYNGLNMYCNTVLKNCKFEFISGKSNFVDFEASGKTLTITNCTATQDGIAADLLDFVGGTYKNQTTIIVDGAVYVTTTDALQVALNNGGKVTLTQDIDLGKIDLTGATTNDVVIDANGHKITTTESYGIEATSGKNITISNADVVMTKEGDYITYAAGFKIANGDYAGATITLQNCTITMANGDWAYAVNMPASVKNLNLVIDNCTLEGAIAVQCWGDNNTITITNSKLICNYTTNAKYTSYCVALQSDGSNVAENNTLKIDNCEFQYSGIDNFDSKIKAAANLGTGNTVTVTNCTYGDKVTAN